MSRFLRIANTRRRSQVVACARRHDLMIHVMRWFFYLNNCFYTPGRYFYTCSLVGFVPGSFLIPRQRLLSVSLFVSFHVFVSVEPKRKRSLSLSLSPSSLARYAKKQIPLLKSSLFNSLLLRLIRLRLVSLALFFLSSSQSLSFPPLGDFQRRHELFPETERKNAFHEREIIPNPVHEFLPVLG